MARFLFPEWTQPLKKYVITPALLIGPVYIVVLAAMGWGAADRSQTLIQPWLLFLPALAVVLAFVARRQIVASEGTRTGVTYASIGWWIAW